MTLVKLAFSRQGDRLGRTGPVSPRPAGVRPSGNKWGRSRAIFAYAPQSHPLQPNSPPRKSKWRNDRVTNVPFSFFVFCEKFSAIFYFSYKMIQNKKNADSDRNFHTETARSTRETPRFTGGSGFQIYVDLFCGAASVYLASLSNRDRGALRVFLRKI